MEIGAKEAASKTCTVSRCDVPGTPGTRWAGISWRGNGLALAKKLKAEGLAFTEVPDVQAHLSPASPRSTPARTRGARPSQSMLPPGKDS